MVPPVEFGLLSFFFEANFFLLSYLFSNLMTLTLKASALSIEAFPGCTALSILNM
jgi:hypothetical protein